MPDPILIASLVGGLLLLALGGDLLVRGAVRASRAMGAAPLIAGIFIVGFGTSLPEILVSVNAAFSGSPGLAVGNIVGSSIANVFLVLAIPALLFPVFAGGPGQGRALFATLLATALWIGMTAIMPLTPLMGICFLLVLIGYTGLSLFAARRDEVAGKPTGVREHAPEGPPLWRALIYVPVGIVALVYASMLIVNGADGIARAAGVPQEYIGLTLLAVGTSLPEIGASLAAAARKRGDVVVGNILGANIINLLGAGGIVAMSGPIEIARLFHAYDHWVMGFAAIVLSILILTKAKIGRLLGLLLLLLYAIYIYGLVGGVSLLGLYQVIAG
ncbi:MAG: sodium:calcium antiporter [Hyphomonas sp.]|uniref:sodium:calcium antiporter n=1 Tax=Hyphomonas sp. TaxID=87 RepID=UPI0034A093D1